MKRSAQHAFGEEVFFEDDDQSPSVEFSVNDLLENRSKSCQVSLDDLIEQHADQWQPVKHCKCDVYSPFITAGPFILGVQLKDAQFLDLDQFIARKASDQVPNRYYLLKIVTLPPKKEDESYSQRQAKLLLFNEFSVLSLLKDTSGVVHHQGLYMDYFYEEDVTTPDSATSETSTPNVAATSSRESYLDLSTNDQSAVESDSATKVSTSTQHPFDHTSLCDCPTKGRLMRRLILALECHIPHIYCSTVYPLPKLFSKFTTVNSEHENLQECVKRFKNIPEMKALLIFKQIVNIIFHLHRMNIAHRDLRLENILYSHRSEKIILVNFGLARYVINDKTCIWDHRGSSAYISPDVLKRKPYNPKASDCWALGIIFYTMLFGKFPFYAESFTELFKKINAGQFTIPSNVFVWKNSHDHQPLKMETHSIVVHYDTIDIINSLIVTEASKRMNIYELRERLHKLIEDKFKAKADLDNSRLIKNGACANEDLQIVPDLDLPEFQHAFSKHNSHEMFANQPGGKMMDSTKMQTTHQISTDSEATSDSALDLSLFGSSSQSFTLSSRYEAHERRNLAHNYRNNRLDSVEHLHDHTYVQQDKESSKGNGGHSFKAYLESTEFRSSSRFITSTYSKHQNRFYYTCGPSIYSNECKNYNSLMLETLRTTREPDSPPKRYRTKSCPISLSPFNAHQTRPSKGFVRLGSKMAKSNFAIFKIDSDIRHLNEDEMNVYKKLSSYKVNS